MVKERRPYAMIMVNRAEEDLNFARARVCVRGRCVE